MARGSLLLLSIVLLGAAQVLAGAPMEHLNKAFQIHGKQITVELRIDGGELHVSRSEEPRTCLVDIAYNPDRCDAKVWYDEEKSVLRMEIDHESLIRREHNDIAKVYLELPPEPVTSLDALIKAGETEFTLGDLSLNNFRLKSTAGEATVDFNLPNRFPMEKLDIHCSVGETTLRNLGNARFRQAVINSGIGELSVDFRGKDFRPGTAKIDLDLGETSITIPREMATRMRVSKAGFLTDFEYSDWFVKRDGDYYSRNYSKDRGSLDLLISSGIGALSIIAD